MVIKTTGRNLFIDTYILMKVHGKNTTVVELDAKIKKS